MAQAALRRIVIGIAVTGWLAGCVGGSDTAPTGGTAAGTAAAPPGQSRSAGSREVEAPEVFQTTDSALWDGRPSLGGIWVASPAAVDPERVVMFNPATGKSVTGALFRRERDNPGPTLQVSSDAADALGMLAGQPTELRVTALKKVEKQAPAAEPSTDAAAAEVAAAPPEGEGSAEETAALAAAALAATGDDAGDKTKAATEAAAGAVEAGTETAAAVAADAVDPATGTEPAKRKTWKERRAEAKAKREAEKAAAAAATAETAPEAAEGTAPTAESAGVSAVETAPLDARSPEVAAAADAATDAPPAAEKKTRKQIRAEEKAAAEAAEAAAAAEAAGTAAPADPAPAASGRPIQVASFSKEENANRAVEALAKIGVTATPQKSEQGGKIVWGVVAVGDDALLQSIKGAGFADAYFLK